MTNIKNSSVKQIKDKMIINDLVKTKGKSKLPKLWNEVLKQKKPNKNIQTLISKCDISIDEYTAMEKWQQCSNCKAEYPENYPFIAHVRHGIACPTCNHSNTMRAKIKLEK